MLQRVLSFDNSIKGVVGGGYTPCVGIGGGAAPFGDAVNKIGPMVRSFLLNLKMSVNLTVPAAGAAGATVFLSSTRKIENCLDTTTNEVVYEHFLLNFRQPRRTDR